MLCNALLQRTTLAELRLVGSPLDLGVVIASLYRESCGLEQVQATAMRLGLQVEKELVSAMYEHEAGRAGVGV